MKSANKIALARRALQRHGQAYGRRIPKRLWELWRTGEALKYDGKCVRENEVHDCEMTWRLRPALPSWEVLGQRGGLDIEVVGPRGEWKAAGDFIPLFHAGTHCFFVAKITDDRCPVGYFEEETFRSNGSGYDNGVVIVAKTLDRFLKSLEALDEPDVDSLPPEDVWAGGAKDLEGAVEEGGRESDVPLAARLFARAAEAPRARAIKASVESKTKGLKLEWKKVKRPPVTALTDRALYHARMEEPFYVGDTQYLVEGHLLRTWVRGAGGWRKLPASKGRDGKVLKITAFAHGRVGVGDRVIAVSGDGDVVEFNKDRWTHRYAPTNTNMPLHSAYIAWDAARERLVAWHGGTITESMSNRYKKMTTWFFEHDAWRQSSFAPPAHNKFLGLPQLVFEPLLGRVVRLLWEELAVLDGDSWHTVKPKGFAYGSLYIDPKTRETLLYSNDALLRFDLDQFRPVAVVAPFEAPQTGERDVISYHANGRRLVSENRADPKLTWELDLAPAFDAAARMGARTGLEDV
jgi:hypothetical protein